MNVEFVMEEGSGEKSWIKLKLNKEKTKKVSDFVDKETAEGSYLWTKSECEIPLVAEWHVPQCFQNHQLSLKIRVSNWTDWNYW